MCLYLIVSIFYSIIVVLKGVRQLNIPIPKGIDSLASYGTLINLCYLVAEQ